ncbi:uncharacterized protein CTRU02_208569 [Colletotrichum truncatum]|uniref:Uncharacterized protein n=1 Tax=Colletotrichum truncatum TaxID=5467 RepID=A0ACC3YWU9_COLTU|nr:uncharacterized protein CTRU02_10324 [Colletotrichum truncatum]KAF6787528.1 hypothetical protein CTRU02_10324 [Colletotrichum truncatum]
MTTQSDSAFENLPTEILEQIILYITDPGSIYHLLVASPAASRVFNVSEAGPKALDNALAETMAPQVCRFIRLVGLIRTATSEKPLAESLRAFAEQYTQRLEGTHLGPVPPLPRSFCGEHRHATRSLLSTVRHIIFLASDCLEHYRRRCLSIKPSHLKSRFVWGSGYAKPWREKPLGEPYKPQDIGPPCWVEEQRVMRGFWRLQLLNEMRTAASEGRLRWAVEDDQKEISADTLFLGWNRPRQPKKEEFLTVVDFVNHTQSGPINADYPLCLPPSPRGHNAVGKWPALALYQQVDSLWERDTLLDLNPAGFGFYMRLWGSHFSPIRGVPFRPYRELGFAIWETDKLTKLKLWWPHEASRDGKTRPLDKNDQIFAWRSLLSQELLAELVEKMDEEYRRTGRWLPQDNPDM